MARQRIRLREVRKSDLWNDHHTPAEIDLSETAAEDEQDLVQYLLSQVRQILGTAHWHNPVPANLTDLAAGKSASKLACLCTVAETIGALVYLSGPKVGDLYQVRIADPTVYAKLPAIGMVVAKADTTHADVQYNSTVSGILSGLTTGKTYFLDSAGQLSLTPPVGNTYVQRIGVALDPTVFLLTPDPTLVKRRAHP